MEKTLEDARWGGGGVQEGRRKRGKGTRTLPCSDAEVNGQREVGEGGKQRSAFYFHGEGKAVKSQVGLRARVGEKVEPLWLSHTPELCP